MLTTGQVVGPKARTRIRSGVDFHPCCSSLRHHAQRDLSSALHTFSGHASGSYSGYMGRFRALKTFSALIAGQRGIAVADGLDTWGRGQLLNRDCFCHIEGGRDGATRESPVTGVYAITLCGNMPSLCPVSAHSSESPVCLIRRNTRLDGTTGQKSGGLRIQYSRQTQRTKSLLRCLIWLCSN